MHPKASQKAQQAYVRYNLPNQVLLTPLVDIPGARCANLTNALTLLCFACSAYR